MILVIIQAPTVTDPEVAALLHKAAVSGSVMPNSLACDWLVNTIIGAHVEIQRLAYGF